MKIEIMNKLVAAFCGLLLVVSDFPVESQGKVKNLLRIISRIRKINLK